MFTLVGRFKFFFPRRLANKQDDKNAVDELDLVDQMNVEYIVNKYKCPTRVEICSALTLVNGKIDPGITNGYKYVCEI